ncbi:hypothetical protein TSMG0042 [Halocynthia phage JM-2012]|uniref:virion structural protein n=1 Tax=Halocynthia phage JM-2012 TaxID=1173297 RepID=UPI00025C68F9|nr:virion structural protein [Halocynthia phage JM-2012]AFI55325.1 hypothetical protein TSMG0042 [Halocynthia phage JM-2012]
MAKKDIVITEASVSQRIDSVASRMVAEGNRSVEKSLSKSGKNISFGAVSPHIQSRVSEKVSNKVILESNPTMSRAIEILTGFIVCPNGGSVVTLHYDASVKSMDDKYNKDATTIAALLDDYFTNTVKLQNEVNTMVYNTLATDGAYVTAFIPDSQITQIYESAALEAEMKKLTDGNTDAAKSNKPVSVIKDPSVLLLSETRRYLANFKAAEAGNESAAGKKAGLNAARVLRKRRVFKESPSVKLSRGKGKDEITAAIRKNIPSEAVKPIVFKGEPNNPYGYIFALDEDGYPIEIDEDIDFNKDLAKLSGDNTSKDQLKKLANNLPTGGSANTLPQLQEEFNKYLETDVMENLISGEYAEKYSLEDDELIKTIMFHRYLKNQKTRLLFMPEHLVNYFCFDTNSQGVGESLISRTKALSKIYTVMFYANFIGNLSNATPHKEVIVDFDSEDIDQNKTLEMVVNELILSRVNSFDFNFNGPSDVIKNIMKHGVEFKLNNLDNGDLPNMNIEVNDKKYDKSPVDTDFLEMLTKLITMRVGFSPELVDRSFSPNFSSQVNQDNDITARQTTRYTTMASEKLSDRVIKETLNTPALLNTLVDSLDGNSEDKWERVETVLANLNVTLPQPSNSSITEKSEIIEDNIKVIQTIVDTIVPDSMFEGVENASREYMEGVREMITSYFMSDYIRRNSSFKHIVDKIRTSDGLKQIVGGEGDIKGIMMEVFAEHAEEVIVRDKVLDKEITDAEDEITRKLEEEANALNDEIEGDDLPNEEPEVEEPSVVEPEDDSVPEPETEDDESEEEDPGLPTIEIP